MRAYPPIPVRGLIPPDFEASASSASDPRPRTRPEWRPFRGYTDGLHRSSNTRASKHRRTLSSARSRPHSMRKVAIEKTAALMRRLPRISRPGYRACALYRRGSRRCPSRKQDQADGHCLEQLVVSLEGRGIAMLRPIRLENDLRHFPALGPAGGDAFGATIAAAVEKDHVSVLGTGLVEDIPNPDMIVVVGPAGEADPMACREREPLSRRPSGR